MENVTKKTEYPCSGCGACAAVCSSKAITLEQDDAGFLIASVDAAKCVNCGICVKVCYRFFNNVAGADLRKAKLYAVQSSDGETVKRCSSGGAAHELAIDAIRSGGKVIGAVYETSNDHVIHKIVADEEGVYALDGSKYLQSNTQEAFSRAVDEAVKDPKACFTVFGTPCQIAGMVKVCELLHIRDRFFLVEIFCHGVPPYALWEHQTERMKKKLKAERFDEIRFRYKKDGWHNYCIRADAGGKSFFGIRERELFWHVYFENVLLGDACMTCRLRKEMSLADLRIGDYWGSRFQSRSDGVSAVFACTERGESTIERLIEEGRFKTFEPGSQEEMLSAQNMEGYSEIKLHEKAIEKLKCDGIMDSIHHYRSKQNYSQRLKRILLRVSSVLPGKWRVKLRKGITSKH